MEKSNLDNVELGILFNNRPVSSYSIDRDTWTDIFNRLLDCGFDGYGYIENNKLNKFIKTEQAIAYRCPNIDTYLSVEEVLKSGTFVNCDGSGDYYVLDDNVYLIYEELEGKYDEDFDRWSDLLDIYQDSLEVWLDENGYEDEDSIPENCVVPYEIQALNPGDKPNPEKYSKVKKLMKVIPYKVKNEYFDNGVFLVRPYYWGESEEIQNKPNFIYYPKAVEINWYKYPFRSATCNQDITDEEFNKIIEECIKSLEVK